MSADITLTGNKVRFVRLTQQDYAAIGTKDVDTLYFITDSTEHPIYRGSERLATYGVATQSTAGLLSAVDKTKLDGIASGAEVNVQSNWNQTNTTADDYIKNKPTSMPASDVSDWAKAATKPTYTASEVGAAPSSHNQALSTITEADDLKAIEALTGTSGLLKKTGTNTWALDMTTYLSSHQAVTLASGTNNGTLKITTAAGPVDNIAVKGLSDAAYKGVVTSVNTSASLPTSGAVKTYVDGAIPTVDQTYNASSANAQSGVAVASAIAALPEPMIFKGSLGTGGTITTLPAASSSNEGFVYKVITAGTYASQSAKVGDTFISDGSSWVLIPSGDEPDGTVTSVATGSGLTGGPITTSGTISLATAYGDTVNPYGNKTANYVLAAPNGSNGTPSFRTLVAADIPSITKSKISDFPSSMPASDVSAWAKASTKPSYTANEVGAQPTLVSGTNIKTINNQSLLGSGDISISSGGGSYCIDIDKWITQTATSQDYADIEDAIQTGKYLYIGQEDEQSGEIFHNPVTCSGITEDSEIICYYIEDDTVHMYTFHSDGTYYYEYHYLQRKLTAGSGIEINSNNVISATGTSYFYKKDESTYTTSSGSTTTIPVGISGFRSTDILMVDVNGLNLVQGTDYTVSGTNIVLTTPITHAGAVVHFTAMRIAEVTPQDYAALKGDKGDSAYTAGTGIKIENGVISIDLQQAESQTF